MGTTSLVVGGLTALRIWRSARIDGLGSADFDTPSFGASGTDVQQRLGVIRELAHSEVVELVARSKSERHQLGGTRDIVWSGPMPESQLASICGVEVCRPALALAQLGRSLDVVDLALLAYEVCGSYAIADWEDGRTCSKLAPLCSVEQMGTFAEGCSSLGVRGAKRLSEALRFACDGSNSPEESRIALIMRLPRLSGGYGLSGFELNHTIALSDKASKIMSWSSITPDFLFPGAKVALEYDSNEWHKTPAAQARDSRRRLTLQSMGYEVKTLTGRQVGDMAQLDLLMDEVAGLVGPRRRPATQRMAQRHLDLHHRLFYVRCDPLS